MKDEGAKRTGAKGRGRRSFNRKPEGTAEKGEPCEWKLANSLVAVECHIGRLHVPFSAVSAGVRVRKRSRTCTKDGPTNAHAYADCGKSAVTANGGDDRHEIARPGADCLGHMTFPTVCCGLRLNDAAAYAGTKQS